MGIQFVCVQPCAKLATAGQATVDYQALYPCTQSAPGKSAIG